MHKSLSNEYCRMLAMNDRQDTMQKHVSSLDVHQIQAKAPDVSETSNLTWMGSDTGWQRQVVHILGIFVNDFVSR